MAVYARQAVDGVMQETLQVANKDELADPELLMRKASSHEQYGWDVTITSATTFTATKTRWSVPCVREFWIA